MSDSSLSESTAELVALYVNNSRQKSSLIKDLKQDSTINQLYQVVESMFGVEEDGFGLISDGELLERGSQTVKARGLIDGTTLIILLCTRGGGGNSSRPTPTPAPKPTPNPNCRLKPLPGFIELTDEPCCVTYDNNPGEKRAKIPCGCVIAAETMKKCVNTKLKDGEYKIKCPGCNVALEFQHVFHVLSAVMTVDELKETSSRMSVLSLQRLELKISHCAMCGTYCTRDTKSNRIKCDVCTKANNGNEVDFCWICSQRWKQNKSGSCESCETFDLGSLAVLADCSTKTVGGVNGVPDTRACPACGILISHRDMCKHIKCECGCNFCFVCLKTKVDNKWQCGEPNTVCPVAPRQIELD